jgi:hypothetical protein
MRVFIFFVATALTGLMSAQSIAAVVAYTQDFEGLDRNSLTALEDDGWRFFANVTNTAGNTVYTYGPFTAPNDVANPNISVISDSGSGGNPPTGSQGLVAFNDYDNGDHGNGMNRTIGISMFQEQTIDAADIGTSHVFSFTAAPQDDLSGSTSTASAFVLTLDPNAGFARTNFLTADTSALAPGNTDFSIQIDLTDPALAGQLLQFGFSNSADNFGPTAVNYDNLSFTEVAAVPEPGSLSMLGLISVGLCVRRRRRKA